MMKVYCDNFDSRCTHVKTHVKITLSSKEFKMMIAFMILGIDKSSRVQLLLTDTILAKAESGLIKIR